MRLFSFFDAQVHVSCVDFSITSVGLFRYASQLNVN